MLAAHDGATLLSDALEPRGCVDVQRSLIHSLRTYPYSMVRPLPRPWSEIGRKHPSRDIFSGPNLAQQCSKYHIT